jgi:hypothetical protein
MEQRVQGGRWHMPHLPPDLRCDIKVIVLEIDNGAPVRRCSMQAAAHQNQMKHHSF